eukprot:CAMPEP_0201876176 /NCGR_PEP_ID=MMETSP0902-20130614/7934_1 /ASSEMBLY_ACC=CAM_ASM_000551 /TAXON_ID=420261 /ORGANISM="Thalassiosira antarctica, Strain CCMP982" /LENGTH=269 /DNA_ID=CAMNT_0048403367 /DNA_START=120 /DNA_END=926 /DNA_ORIENTATION=+
MLPSSSCNISTKSVVRLAKSKPSSSKMGSSSRSRFHCRCIRQAPMLLALLLSAAPFAALAFQSLSTTPHTTRSAGSRITNTKNNHIQQLIISESRRMKSSSSTSLYLFGMNKKDKIEETPPIIDESNNDNNQTFIEKYLPPAKSFLKVAFPSFLAGTAVTLGVLFLPMLSEYYDAVNGQGSQNNFYGSSADSNSKTLANSNANSMNNVNQPVILFETILNDLNDAYVDDVDIQKLFETGVKAMTQSLDPYTEFESRTEAKDLEESVSGR